MEEKRIVELLWTGGWDSTYRLVELSREDVTVRPVYLCGAGRISEQQERKAMDEILAVLRARPETQATILPVDFVELASLPENPEMTAAYRRIHAETGLGYQHEPLARLAALRPGIELGHELGTSGVGHLTKALNTFCCMETDSEGKVHFNHEKSTPEGNLILGNFSYPIMDKTEQDMVENIRAWGYEDVMSHIWFCQRPIDGAPCGVCHPCQVKIGSGMAFLLPQKAIRRNALFGKLKRRMGEKTARQIARLFYR